MLSQQKGLSSCFRIERSSRNTGMYNIAYRRKISKTLVFMIARAITVSVPEDMEGSIMPIIIIIMVVPYYCDDVMMM